MAATSTHCTRAIHALIIMLLALPDIATLFHLKGNIFDTSPCRCGNTVDSFPSFSSLPRARERVCESLLWCLEFPRLLRNAFRNGGEKAALLVVFHFIFFLPPVSSVTQLKWVFLTAYSVKLGGEFGLVLSRWLHPRLDYSLGFKPGPILKDAVWHFSLAYKKLPYIGPGLLSLCLPLHWPPTEQ